MRYIRPTSLTWWAGLLAFATGTASLVLPATGPLADLARLIETCLLLPDEAVVAELLVNCRLEDLF